MRDSFFRKARMLGTALAFISYVVGGEGHRQAAVRHSLTKAKTSIPYSTYKLNTFLLTNTV